MKAWWGLAIAMGWVAACNADATSDAAENDVGDSGSGGAGGSGGSGGCTLDTHGSAGAVAISTVVPPPGSWCPSDGIELCTEPEPAFFNGRLPDGGPVPATVSRCLGNAWENTEVDACEPTSHRGCNIPARFTDGACCTAMRNCFEAFCDGERWWTVR